MNPELALRLRRHLGRRPDIDPTAWVHPSAVVVGDVVIGPRSSVWPTCVLRGDIHEIRIGADTNIQDGSIIHLADEFGAYLGDRVTIGHGAIIHACRIEDECLIGMRAVVLDGAVIGHGSIVGAGAVVPKGLQVPPGSLVLGLPAKVARPLRPDELTAGRELAEKYVQVMMAHRLAPSPSRSLSVQT